MFWFVEIAVRIHGMVDTRCRVIWKALRVGLGGPRQIVNRCMQGEHTTYCDGGERWLRVDTEAMDFVKSIKGGLGGKRYHPCSRVCWDA